MSKRITAAQCEAAAELLAERVDISQPIRGMRNTKCVRLSYEVILSYVVDDGRPSTRGHFTDGPEIAVDDGIRQLLLAGIERQLAEIDAKLRAIGVEPPDDAETEDA